ncbi:hypothetical protein VdG1_00291 [Verticillium dahliae VDG1]|nr:hypothetical protein VdG1_00291 [Verticillium dahliae VDG1]
MANFGDEAVDLAALGGALVVNMGTVTPEGLDNYAKALRAYNAVGQPVVFDPVGFVPVFLDELATVRQMTVDGDLAWLAAAKVSLADEA